MVPVTTNTRRFPPTEAPPYVPQINDSVFEDDCMLEPSFLIQRKRSRSEQHSGRSEASPPNKRRKTGPSSESPAFWDNLSKIWLTNRALRELDRRNTQAISSAPCTPQKQSNIASERERAYQLCSHDPSAYKDLKSFSRTGGPDLSDLRSFPEPFYCKNHTMSASHSSTQSQRDSASASTRPTTNTTRTKSTGVYERNFQQHLVDNKIYPYGYRRPDGSVPIKPVNWKDINDILVQPRPSLSPSMFDEEDYERFVQADADASKEKQVSELVIPFIEGEIQDAKCRSGGIPFTNLDPLTDGTLKPGNPDVYYGARPEQLTKQVRTELSGFIIPSTQYDLPMAPNFFLAAKGPDGSIAVAGRQACYDGALGARGMTSLESYGQDERDGLGYSAASTISSIYHGGQLKMYTSHVTQPSKPGGLPEYHMTQLNTWGMTGNSHTFREGATAYRNGRDWAKERRDNLIRQANERATLAEVETSTNDNEAEASPALSFVTAASDTEACTMSQESRTTLNEVSNMLGIFEEPNISMETLADNIIAKPSNKRKRHSTGSEA